MRVAIVGSRSFPNREVVEQFVCRLPIGATVVSGGAKGVDSWAVEAAHQAGLETLVLEADWKTHGRSAGPIRNLEIVRQTDEVAAFWDGASRGTLNTVALAIRLAVPVSVYGGDGIPLELSVVMGTATSVGVVASIDKAFAKN